MCFFVSCVCVCVCIQDQWLVDASVNLNPKLRLSPRNQVIALYAITRLDISNNALTELPDMIFQLPSLKVGKRMTWHLVLIVLCLIMRF